MLVYIENKNHLAQVLSILDLINIPYTTNVKEKYHTVLITDINSRILKIIKNKKVILYTNYIEEKILTKKFLIPSSLHSKIITSLSILKKRNDTVFIPNPIPKFTTKKNKLIYEKYHLSKNKKRIIIIDLYLEYLNQIEKIIGQYPKYEIIYIGYRNLKKEEKQKINNLDIVWIKYIDLDSYNDLCNISDLAVVYSQVPIMYLYMTILSHTELFLIEDNIYSNYLIASKHYYSFVDTDQLILKINKLLNNRTSSLNDNAYFLIEKNTESTYLEQLKKTLE